MKLRRVWFFVLFALTFTVGMRRAEATDGTPRLVRSPQYQIETLRSEALRGELRYCIYLPPGYEQTPERRYPALYLLHGRGDTMDAWLTVLPDIEAAIIAGRMPPVIAILPDAPSSRRAGYYVDSAFAGRGADDAGGAIETAFTRELIPHIDAKYRTEPTRVGRLVGGYSMGGFGALRLALAYPALFSGAIVLSPAVYTPLPPQGSSTREFGAFGEGSELFVDAIYQAKNYPALLPTFETAGLPLRLFIAVGDDEYPHADPAEWKHDLDYEAHTLYNRVRRSKLISAELRVIDGGHNWNTWRPAFAEGLCHLFAAPIATAASSPIESPRR